MRGSHDLSYEATRARILASRDARYRANARCAAAAIATVVLAFAAAKGAEVNAAGVSIKVNGVGHTGLVATAHSGGAARVGLDAHAQQAACARRDPDRLRLGMDHHAHPRDADAPWMRTQPAHNPLPTAANVNAGPGGLELLIHSPE